MSGGLYLFVGKTQARISEYLYVCVCLSACFSCVELWVRTAIVWVVCICLGGRVRQGVSEIPVCLCLSVSTWMSVFLVLASCLELLVRALGLGGWNSSRGKSYAASTCMSMLVSVCLSVSLVLTSFLKLRVRAAFVWVVCICLGGRVRQRVGEYLYVCVCLCLFFLCWPVFSSCRLGRLLSGWFVFV